MQRILTAIATIALAGAIAVPAKATSFPGLTLIYVASGVVDRDSNPAVATTIPCTNLSGKVAAVRWLFVNDAGTVEGSKDISMSNGVTQVISTAQSTDNFTESVVSDAASFQGQVRVYSTQSAVFCSVLIASPDNSDPGNALHLVRFNANPGTDE
jgi:hypothetical protein